MGHELPLTTASPVAARLCPVGIYDRAVAVEPANTKKSILPGAVAILILVAIGFLVHWHPSVVIPVAWAVVGIGFLIAWSSRSQTVVAAQARYGSSLADASADVPEVDEHTLGLLIDHGREVVRVQVAEGDSQTIRAAAFIAVDSAGIAFLLANRHAVPVWIPILVALLLSGSGMTMTLLKGKFSTEAGLSRFLKTMTTTTTPSDVAVKLLGELQAADPLNELTVQRRQASVQFGTIMLTAAMLATVVWLVSL